MSTRPDFIDALVEDMTPVRPAPGWVRTVVLWSASSWAFVTLGVLLGGPLRDGAIASALDTPTLALELMIALACGLAAISAGLELGVPGGPTRLRLVLPALVLAAGWLALVYLEIEYPVVEPSMAGKRSHCFRQSLALAMPPWALGFHLLRRRVAFADAFAGLLIGVASAAIPAFWMQLACMHDPIHALQYHLSPIVLFGGIGALVAVRCLPRA